MKCIRCGREIPEDANVCCYCGNAVEHPAVVQCPNCGKVFYDSEVYCDNCGTKLTAQQQVQRPAPRKVTHTAKDHTGLKPWVWILIGVVALPVVAVSIWLIAELLIGLI